MSRSRTATALASLAVAALLVLAGCGSSDSDEATDAAPSTTRAAESTTTKVAAECLGWQDRLGTLEADKLADVVITASDPLANIRSLEDVRNIRIVIQDGRLVKG